ncbi:MAG: MerR family transcriptional regulator [Pseudomonadota bacterium]
MRPQQTSLALPLPEIPPKRYFAIGEVSELCAVKPHVLRYWEQEFPQLKPVKRRGNRRYYQQDDVQMVRRIRSLLYEQGFTIGGARLRLKESLRLVVPAPKLVAPPASTPQQSLPQVQSAVPAVARKTSKAELSKMRADLEAALKLLDR